MPSMEHVYHGKNHEKSNTEVELLSASVAYIIAELS